MEKKKEERKKDGFLEIPEHIGKEAKNILVRLSNEMSFGITSDSLKIEGEDGERVHICEVCEEREWGRGRGELKISYIMRYLLRFILIFRWLLLYQAEGF